MSGAQWTSPGRIVTGLVSAAVIAAALASATGSQRAQSLGLTQHGALITAQDAGAADAVAAVAVAPGTVGQVLTVGDAGLPVWRAAASGASVTAGLDNARPSPTLGAIYSSTDTLVRWVAESDGSGGTRWAVLGARGTEGRDTTAVSASPSCTAVSIASVLSSAVVSYALTWSMSTPPSGVGVLVSILSGSGWQIEIGNDSGDRYRLSTERTGFSGSRQYLGTISASPTTVHSIAVTMSGATTRWSLDGGAVQTVSHGTGSATAATTVLRFAANSGGFGASSHTTSFVAWSTTVGDADLVAVSTAGRAAGSTPGRIPAVAGATELARWHAAQVVAGTTAPQLLGGSIGGTISWSAAPQVTIR